MIATPGEPLRVVFPAPDTVELESFNPGSAGTIDWLATLGWLARAGYFGRLGLEFAPPEGTVSSLAYVRGIVASL